MSIILKKPIATAAAWKGSELQNDSSWITQITPDELAEIDDALASLSPTAIEQLNFSGHAFAIPKLARRLSEISHELEHGRGFALLRGLPVDRYDEPRIRALCFGIGLHMGTPVRQNPRGDLLGEVMNVGDLNDKNTRVYETNLYLPYHSDPSDVVGLLCLRKAHKGGLSSLVSVASIYNAILSQAPEYLALYYRLWYFSHLCEPQPSLSPIFSFHQGKLSCRYLRQYIELGHELRQLPLSKVEIEALDCFDATMNTPGLPLDMMLEPGDLQFANNYAVLHSRTAFEDVADPGARRKMLRLWVKMPNARTLAPEFPGRNGFPDPMLK